MPEAERLAYIPLDYHHGACTPTGASKAVRPAMTTLTRIETGDARVPGATTSLSIVRPVWAVIAAVVFAVPAAAQEPGAYCEAGSDALARFTLTRRNPTTAPDASLVYNNCSPGDTIIIAGGHLGLIAKVCDFSRSVVATPGGNVLCVVSPQRPVRSNRK
jgi:hypothetical protein